MLMFAAMALIVQDAQAAEPSAPPADAVAPVAFDIATPEKGAETREAKIIADCSAHSFQTSVEVGEGADKRVVKLKLCSVAKADDKAWLNTLRDARMKIAADPDIAAASKARIDQELGAEIRRVSEAADTKKK